MPKISGVEGQAALTICDSLLLALNDRNAMPEEEIVGALVNAVETLENDQTVESPAGQKKAAAALIRKIISGGNSVRRI